MNEEIFNKDIVNSKEKIEEIKEYLIYCLEYKEEDINSLVSNHF
jgi:hypothetical protein